MDNSVVMLSELGARQALDVQGRGVQSTTLTVLYENGPMSIEELTDEVGLDPDKMGMVLRALDKKGYLRGLA